jgi:hypothetical protein
VPVASSATTSRRLVLRYSPEENDHEDQVQGQGWHPAGDARLLVIRAAHSLITRGDHPMKIKSKVKAGVLPAMRGCS